MHALILGGSPHHPGGVEAFAERAAAALGQRPGWNVSVEPTGTAFLSSTHVPALASRLAGMLLRRKPRPDVVWLQYTNLPDLSFVLAARLAGLRVVVTPHLGANWRSQESPPLRALSAKLLGLAHRIALISQTQEEEVALPAGVPRRLIRTFLPPEALANTPRPEAPSGVLRLIHSARLSEGKGTFHVVEVCAQLRDAGVPFQCWIAGGAEEETLARLQALIAERSLEAEVTLLGRLPTRAMMEAIRGADVLLHLSRIDSYPLIVLEAMACGTLPVCVGLAGARAMIEAYDGHAVSEAGAVVEAAALLSRLAPEEARRRGATVAERVRADHDWERAASLVAEALTY